MQIEALFTMLKPVAMFASLAGAGLVSGRSVDVQRLGMLSWVFANTVLLAYMAMRGEYVLAFMYTGFLCFAIYGYATRV